ncbi:P-loop containing nucleoside triphosphate hydrolase protein [Schizothecium vesticola]|uniref:P-loop containing nucleoside triphosphate hydrolase protein n=1 Tax=Schizothecium vesticola TaxID=314040 RepID=A0AA40EQA6_9PEZI|nr:P-loop containing nucleoside triphosphate hydrolase protein [Schizothecium vesticola]
MSESATVAVDAPKTSEVAETEQKKPRNPILRYDEIFDVQTGQTRLVKTERSELKRQSGRKGVLCVRRIFDNKGLLTKTDVDIKSSHVATAMQDMHSDVDGISLRTRPPVVPHEIFFHSKIGLEQKLEDARKSENPNQDQISDLVIAANFAREEFEVITANVDALLASGEMTWDLLWTIFAPNVLVYRYHPLVEEHQVLKLRTMRKVPRPDGSIYWEVNCHIVADDGVKFGLAYEPYSMSIDQFDGARKIVDLPVFPLDYHPDSADVHAKALSRGRRFADLRDTRVMETSGPAMFEKRLPSNWRAVPYKFSSHGRAIVDVSGFRSFNANLESMPPRVHRTLSRDGLTYEQLLICTPVILGFCFGNKKWGGFGLSRLRDVTWNDQVFHDLVLAKPSKTLVHAMVKQQTSEDSEFDDIISGKGKGIVCLFSGPPGSGKTLTAEAVAELTKRPLYSVSAGDLGIEPRTVDETLSQALELASKWNAVLLLDEADVFLQARTAENVKRNALVSIFLRQLEYYQGILILTTNRIGQFDAAFESRVHVSLQYPDLDENSRRQIWKTFIRNLRESGRQNVDVRIEDKDLARLARLNVNGRQIKNIINCARIVAKDMDDALSVSHIDLVLEVTGRTSGKEQVKTNGFVENGA